MEKEASLAIPFITLLLACQLAGETIRLTTGVPVPGPVIGMALLFAGLVVKGGMPDGLRTTANGILSNLSLLFVPAGVGVMLHVALLKDEWLPLTLALVGSAVVTVGVTALLMAWLARRTRAEG
jgi:holin-like protein